MILALSSLILPRAPPRYYGADISHPYYALFEFLTHKTHENNQMSVVLYHNDYCSKFECGLLHSNR